MPKIELKEEEKVAAIEKLKAYCQSELDIELGSFDAQFLLEYFIDNLAWSIYNQGLADAFSLVEGSLEDLSEKIYELEQSPPG